MPVLIPKQFSDFEKIKKIQERILLHQKLEEKNPKNVFLKAERVVKSIFSFSLTPLNVAFLIPKQFSDFEKSKKNKKDTFYSKNWKNPKNVYLKAGSGQIDFFLFFDPPKCACSDAPTLTLLM